MQRTVSTFLIRLVVATLTAIVAASCTLIGWGIGSRADKKSPARRTTIPGWDLQTVAPGANVEVLLTNGDWVVGEYLGLLSEADEAYALRYAQVRNESLPGAILPSLGAGMTLKTTAGRETGGELVGFDRGRVHVRLPGRSDLTHVKTSEVARLLDQSGASVSGENLEALFAAGKLPALSSMSIKTRVGSERLSLDRVVRIDLLQEPNGGKLTGLLIGGAIDLGIILAVTKPTPTPVPSSPSCPLVYSFDGKRMVLDAEPFGGAIVELAQRADWSRLDHLRPTSDGAYRLRLANELQEIDHVDELKLLVVDHAPGATLAPDLYGGLHVLAAPAPPSAAHDLRGLDVRELVSRIDGREWLGNPFDRDPEVAADLRDGLVLDFPRPASASQAVLTVTAQSTPFFPALFHQVLSLQGRDLDAWYRRVAVDAAAQRSLERLSLEVAPAIRLWTGSDWKAVDLLAALPTAVAGTQAVRVDLKRVPGDVLRVRIDGLPGTWSVDAVSADFSAPAPVEVVELSPTVARAPAGRDVRGPLRAVDRDRVVLQAGEAVDLTFAAPPPRPGRSRSLVLKTTGYYQLLLPTAGEPQAALFDQILDEPGALARYALRWVQGETRLALARPQ